MANILISTLGSAGDIHPYLAIAVELVGRGHRVAMMTNPVFQERIVHCGVTFYPIGTAEDYYRVITNTDLANPFKSPLLVLRELMGGTIEGTIGAMEHAIESFGPDVVLRHHISIGSRWMARKHNIPVVTGALAPMFFMNPDDPSIHNPLQGPSAGRRTMQFRMWVQKLYLRWFMDRPLNRKRAAYGFARERDIFRLELRDCERLLGLWSPAFRGPMAGDPAHSSITGFCTFDNAHPSERNSPYARALEEFMMRDEPAPIVFTLGSSIVHHHNGFYDLAARVVSERNARAVLLVGDEKVIPRDLPPGILAVPYAPYRAVLPRASAIVHHGGVGTTGAGLGAGVPSLVIAFANDEFDNAARVQRLRAGLSLHARKLSLRTLRSSLDELLTSKEIAQGASRIGSEMKRDNGPGAAADAVLGAMRGG